MVNNENEEQANLPMFFQQFQTASPTESLTLAVLCHFSYPQALATISHSHT